MIHSPYDILINSTMTDVVDFTTWLEDNKLSQYLAAFQAEGYDDLEVLIELPDEEIVEWMDQLNMKKGHRVKLPLAIKKAKQEQRKAQMDKEEVEEDRIEERKLAKQERQKKAATIDPGTEQTLAAADKPGEVLLPAHKKVSACIRLRAAV